MRLTSSDGAEVEIRPTRYEYPGETGGWDANWLIIEGCCQLAGGRRWSFRDPCMTTGDASGLARWLRQVVVGKVEPSDSPSEENKRLKVFTEPNLAFSLASQAAGRVTLRVHFSLEALPPWLPDEDIHAYFVALEMGEAALRSALLEWESDRKAFPSR